MKRLPWILCLCLTGLLVADHRDSTISWAIGYGSGLADAARVGRWAGQHSKVAAPLLSAYLRSQGGAP